MDLRLVLFGIAVIIAIAGFRVHQQNLQPEKRLIQVEITTAARDGVPDRRIGGGTR